MKLYKIYTPAKNGVPILANLPHSGTYVPPSVKTQFQRDPTMVLPNIDWHLEKLYDFLPEFGITLMQATHSRYVVNLNRSLHRPLFGPERLSVIAEHDTQGSFFYKSALKKNEIEERINKYYKPYHRQLKQILDKIVRRFGRAYLLDLHSYLLGPTSDICLGDNYGTTCSENLVGCFEKAFREYKFSVVRNDVWIGGYITRYYGSIKNIEALQIEIKFPAYLKGEEFTEKEITEWDSDLFRNTRQRLKKAFSDVISCLLDVN